MRRGNDQFPAVRGGGWRSLSLTGRSSWRRSGFLSRIVPDQSEHFLDLAGATIRAVIPGRHRVAIIQSLLAGIGSSWPASLARPVGLRGLAVVHRADRRNIVILPVIIWIWTDKDFATALLLTTFLVIVAVLDNILKPLVMGRGLTTRRSLS